MQYIFKFIDNWTIIDDEENTNRPLTSQEIDSTKSLFGKLLKNKKIWIGLQVTPIPPNKLEKLTLMENQPNPRKPGEGAAKG